MNYPLQDAPSYPLTNMPYLGDTYVIGYIPKEWAYQVLFNLRQLYGEDREFGTVSYSNPDTVMVVVNRSWEDEDEDDEKWDQSLCYFDGSVQTMKLIFR